jgi:hypothetical protein
MNKKGAGATFCAGAKHYCEPHCTDQPDPSLFCQCLTLGSACQPSGTCALSCTTAQDCLNGGLGDACNAGVCCVKSTPAGGAGACQ